MSSELIVALAVGGISLIIVLVSYSDYKGIMRENAELKAKNDLWKPLLKTWKDEYYEMQKLYLQSLCKSQGEKNEKCPICGYDIENCQCRFGGNAHPDRSDMKEVVKDNLHLLSQKQIEHLIELERYWDTSYKDTRRQMIKERLKVQKENGN